MELGDVTLVHDCMICRREVILMARKTVKKATLPEKGSTLPQVCEECRTKYLKEGVLLINPHNGRLVVLKDEAFTRMFTSPIPPHKIAFTEDAVLDRFQSKEIQG